MFIGGLDSATGAASAPVAGTNIWSPRDQLGYWRAEGLYIYKHLRISGARDTALENLGKRESSEWSHIGHLHAKRSHNLHLLCRPSMKCTTACNCCSQMRCVRVPTTGTIVTAPMISSAVARPMTCVLERTHIPTTNIPRQVLTQKTFPLEP